VSISRREPVTCGVDIGSTNIKVAALDRAGSVLARASRPTPRDPYELTLDTRVLFDVVEELVVEACGNAYAAHALCTVGVGEDGVLVDSDLVPLSAALAWFDPRRQGVFRVLRPLLSVDEELDAAADAARTMVGWAWARQQPGTDAAHSWIAVADLAAVLWTGRLFLSDTLASRTGAWRASSRTWSPDRVALTLGPLGLLPPVLAAGVVVGPVRSPMLRAAGVVGEDAVAVAGGHDHPVGGWAVDQLEPGSVLDSMGTAEVIVTQSPLAPSVHRARVDIGPGIRSTGTTVLSVIELARNVAWAAQDPDVGVWIEALLAGKARPEPVLEAGYFRPGRRGGNPPSYASDVPRDRRVKASAVLGALACEGRDSVDAVSDGTSVSGSSRVLLAGGGSRAPGWVDLKEAVAGYRSEPIAEPEVTAVGAALLAATALGWAPDPAAALGRQRPSTR